MSLSRKSGGSQKPFGMGLGGLKKAETRGSGEESRVVWSL